MRRRAFLVGASAALAGGVALWAFRDPGDPSSLLFDSDAARRIGARFAERYPEGERALWRGAAPARPEDWPGRLDALSREDLEADRVVQVDGWWLTETELRFCVVLHSMDPAPA